MGTTIRFPIFQTNFADTVTPTEIIFNGSLQFFMAAIVRIVQGKLPQGGKMTFDPIQPRRTGGREVKLDLMGGGIEQHLCLQVERSIVQSEICRGSLADGL